MDMQNVQNFNSGFKYAILGYDTYSKYTICYITRDRKPDSVQKGLEYFVKTLPFTIKTIYWDKEGSFLSKKIQNWLKSRNIHNYTTNSKVKAPNVERLIRTVRTAMQRYFTFTKTWRWIEWLPKFLSTYNNRKHSVTGQRPVDLVADPLTLPKSRRIIKPPTIKLPAVGSFVRLNRLRGTFEKEASGNWTREIFRVTGHKTAQSIPMINIEDLTNEPVKGALYPEEYISVPYNGVKTISKVLAKRTRNGQKEQLVTYEEYPEKYSEWVPVEGNP